jgi:ABC-2 type transport system ATP-binding protein
MTTKAKVPLLIHAENLTKTFGRRTVVKNLDLDIKQGEIFGFLGPHDAGKTTTIRMIMGFVKPTSGKITVFGKTAFDPMPRHRHELGYVSTSDNLYPDWTAKDHIYFVERVYNLPDSGRKLAEKLKLNTTVMVKQLSQGDRQKLDIILALISQPSLLVLDEPTQGLDTATQEEIHELFIDFRNQGGTIFLSSHDLFEIEKLCDRVGVIRNGEMFEITSIRKLKERTVHECYATFHEPIKLSQFEEIHGVTVTGHTTHSINLRVRGDIAAVIHLIAASNPVDFEVTHSSIEDILKEYYK